MPVSLVSERVGSRMASSVVDSVLGFDSSSGRLEGVAEEEAEEVEGAAEADLRFLVAALRGDVSLSSKLTSILAAGTPSSCSALIAFVRAGVDMLSG